MLVCVNFTKSDIDRGSIYKILDTDDYTVEDILGSDLQKALINKVIDVCNISIHKGSYGYIYYKIDNVRLFDRGYTELSCGVCIYIGNTLDVWYKNKSYSMNKMGGVPISSMIIMCSYCYRDTDEIILKIGLNNSIRITGNTCVVQRGFPPLSLSIEGKVCSKLDFKKRLLLC